MSFNAASTPQITGLSGTIFALVASYAFEGFQAPVESVGVNVAKAGRAIPLKWRVLDLGGNPVANLTAPPVKVTSAGINCDQLSGQPEEVDAYATGASGLINQGSGNYQFNWATDGAWAGTCRRVQLDLGDKNPDGTPQYRTADFRFTR